MRLIRLDSVEAEEALGLLPVFLLRYVRVDQEANGLVATGPTVLLDKIEEHLRAIDLAPLLIDVQVQVIAYFGDRTLSKELGLSLGGEGLSSDIAADGVSGTYALVGGLAPSVEGRLKALAMRGAVRVCTKEHICVLNGEKGEIFVGDRPTIVTSFFEEMTQTTRPELTVIDVGAKLEVEPWTGNGRDITIRLAPAVTSIRGTDPVSNLPIVSVQNLEGTLRMNAGESALLGGLVLSYQSRSELSNSVFSDLPVLESLFSSRQKDRHQVEISFLVTPRIA